MGLRIIRIWLIWWLLRPAILRGARGWGGRLWVWEGILVERHITTCLAIHPLAVLLVLSDKPHCPKQVDCEYERSPEGARPACKNVGD